MNVFDFELLKNQIILLWSPEEIKITKIRNKEYMIEINGNYDKQELIKLIHTIGKSSIKISAEKIYVKI